MQLLFAAEDANLSLLLADAERARAFGLKVEAIVRSNEG